MKHCTINTSLNAKLIRNPDKDLPFIKMVEKFSRYMGASGTLWGIGDQIVLSAMNFMLMLILARFTSTAELGLYALASSILVLLITAQDAVVTRPYSIQFFKPIGGPVQHASNSLALSLCLSVAGSLILLFAALYFLQNTQPQSARISIILAAGVPFILLREFARRHCLANMFTRKAFGVDAMAALVTLVLVLIAVAGKYLDAQTAITALAAGSLASGFWWLFGNWGTGIKTPADFKTATAQSWGLGKWLLLSQSAMQLQGYAIHWLCLLLIGVSATGAYAAILSVIALANPFLFGFFNLLMPKSVRKLHAEGLNGVRAQVWRDSVTLTLMMGLFAAAIYFFGGRIMALLYPGIVLPDGIAGVNALTITALAGAVGAAGGPAAIALQGMELGQPLAYLSIATGGIGILFSWFLVLHLGVNGAALGFLATETIGLLARVQLFRRRTEQ